MNSMEYNRIQTSVSFFISIILTTSLFAGASDPPNFVPSLTIQYKHPQTKKLQIHKIDSYAAAQKTYQVPGGVELTLIFETHNIGGNPGGDGISTDVWLDWTSEKLPSDDSSADFVCVPVNPSDCWRFTEKIKADANFNGSDGKGVYSILIWVDRFDTQSEDDEKDNIMGPVKIVAEEIYYLKQPSVVKPKTPVLKTPTKVKKSAQ